MLIQIRNLKKTYRRKIALDIDTLDIAAGELVGLVGNNGAGKSTLLQLMLDLTKADTGSVYIDGHEVSSSEEWKNCTSAYLDHSFLIDFLGAQEYFDFIGQCYTLDSAHKESCLKTFTTLMNGEVLGNDKYIRDLSAGNKQKVGIMGAILPSPKVLILDEPFNFLDPSSQYFLQDYLIQLNRTRKTTIILSSHNIDHVTKIASRIIGIEQGKKIMDIRAINEQSVQELKDYFMRKGNPANATINEQE